MVYFTKHLSEETVGKKQRLKQLRKEEKQKTTVRTLKWQSNAVIVGVIIAIVSLVAVYGYYAYQKKTGEFNGRVAVIETSRGVIKFRLFEEDAPITAANFVKLAKKDFYNSTKFHRVEKGKLRLIQGGDPNSRDSDPNNDGQGGPGYTIPPEIELDKNEQPKHKNEKGAVGMARAQGDMNSNGSQFYILLADQPEFDGGYTIFGKVIKGLDVAKKIEKGDKIKKVTIEGSVTLD